MEPDSTPLETLLARFREEAATFDHLMRQDLAEVSEPLLAQVLEHALFQGGKRVRPLLTLLAAGLLAPPAPTVRRLAIAFEYLHAASLLHDDVIDQAGQRRGRETANRRWDNSPVILAGDFLHARALALAGEALGAEGVALVSRAVQAMIEAEFLQMRLAAQPEQADRRSYFLVLQGKTAALIAAACEAGILAAGGDQVQAGALRTYGNNLGVAFQIVDDLLDYQGDPGRTGKEVGSDLREGKQTLPLLYALERCSRKERDEALQLLRQEAGRRRQGFEAIQRLISAYDGFDVARRTAGELIDQAVLQLDAFADGPARQSLVALSRYVLARDH